MTREERIAGLMKIAGFFEARADMAVGDGKMLLLNWMKCAREAAEAMMEPEARVLSLDEYKARAGQPREQREPVWEEWKVFGYGSWKIPQKAYTGYGPKWRAWTGRPTEEQRGATPWTE